MSDYPLRRTGRCAVTGETIAPGTPIVSVLLDRGDGLERQDVLQSAWTGPPEDCVGSWRTVMPGSTATPRRTASKEDLWEFFQTIPEEAGDLRLVTALLLVRKRVLRWEDTTADDPPRLQLVCLLDGTTWEIADCQPEAERAAAIQTVLLRLLDGTDSG